MLSAVRHRRGLRRCAHSGGFTAAIEMRLTRSRTVRLLGSAALIALVAGATAGCQTTQSGDSNGILGAAASASAPTAERSESDWRHDLAVYGPQYRADPMNLDVALHYAQALRATGQRAQAVAVLERVSLQNPKNKMVLGEYGRALAEAGNFQQAFEVLDRAHTPDAPDWHILSAQGAVLDQLGRHAEAQRYYLTALKIVPDEPTVLSNLGLSYALAKNLPKAESTLQRAAAQHPADPRVRQNLALVVGLEGRLNEAENIAGAGLPPEQAAANVAYLRQMLTRNNALQKPTATLHAATAGSS